MKIRAIRGQTLPGDTTLDFELHDETFYIDLAPDESQWLVFAQSATGVRRIPVYVDAVPSDEVKIVTDPKRQIVN